MMTCVVSTWPIGDEQMRLLDASGSGSRAHSGRTLKDHLLGTHALLKSWGAPERVCLGALFHSIYGTNAFTHSSLSLEHRNRVRDVIGAEAEQLAYLFCTINRPQALIACLNGQVTKDRLTGQELNIPRGILCDLLLLECANLIEQGGSTSALRDIFCVALGDRNLLPAEAYAALKKHLSTPVSLSRAHAEAQA